LKKELKESPKPPVMQKRKPKSLSLKPKRLRRKLLILIQRKKAKKL